MAGQPYFQEVFEECCGKMFKSSILVTVEECMLKISLLTVEKGMLNSPPYIKPRTPIISRLFLNKIHYKLVYTTTLSLLEICTFRSPNPKAKFINDRIANYGPRCI